MAGYGTARGNRRGTSVALNHPPQGARHVPNKTISHQSLFSEPASPHPPLPAETRRARSKIVLEEPPFVTEEREAWSRRSPEHGARGLAQTNEDRRPHATRGFLADSMTNLEPQAPLRPFAPCRSSTDAAARPKTRRGPLHTASDSDQTLHSSTMLSKFSEGSMTSRSNAVASSWPEAHSEYETSESEMSDVDTTPRAQSPKISLDLREFGPSPTSAPTKKTLFRRRSTKPSRKSIDHDEMDPDTTLKPRRRGLRKSLSSWRLQSIGEKLGLRNGSTASVDESEGKFNAVLTKESDQLILDVRKRKAEQIYASSFGMKKQKQTFGTPRVDDYEYQSEPDVLVSDTVRGREWDADATLKARSGTEKSRRRSLGSSEFGMLARQAVAIDHDARKRPSRRELEKENQLLRAMLSEHQSNQRSTQIQESATMRRRSALPVAICPTPVNGPRVDLQASARADGLAADGHEVPPLPPQDPRRQQNRRPLCSIENRTLPASQMNVGLLVKDDEHSKRSIGTKIAPRTAQAKSENGLQTAGLLSPSPDSASSGRTSPSSVRSKRSTASLARPMTAVIEDPDEDSYLDDSSSAGNSPGKKLNSPRTRNAPAKAAFEVFTEQVENEGLCVKPLFSSRPNGGSRNLRSSAILQRNAKSGNGITGVMVRTAGKSAREEWQGWDDDVF